MVSTTSSEALFAGALESARLLDLTHGDESYARVIERVRGLEGRVASPEDPSIALRAKGVSGTVLYFELDAAPVAGGWTSTPPERVARELAGARWLVAVRSPYPSVLTAEWLQARGWRLVRPPEGEERSIYELWTREGAERPATPPP